MHSAYKWANVSPQKRTIMKTLNVMTAKNGLVSGTGKEPIFIKMATCTKVNGSGTKNTDMVFIRTGTEKCECTGCMVCSVGYISFPAARGSIEYFRNTGTGNVIRNFIRTRFEVEQGIRITVLKRNIAYLLAKRNGNGNRWNRKMIDCDRDL